MFADYLKIPLVSNTAFVLFAFLIGNVSGYLFHDVLKKSFNMSESSSKNFLLVMVTIMWTISMIYDILSPSYDVPVAVHALMGAIVGFFFYRPKGDK